MGGGGGVEEGCVDVAEPLSYQVLNFLFLLISGIFNVIIEVPSGEGGAGGGGEFGEERGGLGPPGPWGKIDRVDGEGCLGATFLEFDGEYASGDDDPLT